MRILVRLIFFPLEGQRQEVRLGGGEQGGKKIRQGSSYPSSSLRTMTVHLNRRLVKRFRFPAKSCRVLSCRHSTQNESEAKYIYFSYEAVNCTTQSWYKFNFVFFKARHYTTRN